MDTQVLKDASGWRNVFKIILPLFLIVGGVQLISGKILGISLLEGVNTMKTGQLLLLELVSTLAIVFVVRHFRIRVDKCSFESLGFQKSHARFDIASGIIVGFLIMAFAFIGLLFTGQIRFVSFDFKLIPFIESLLIYILVAISEELLMRGYVLNNLLASFNKYIALIISSFCFSLMHLGNDHISLLGLTGLFAAGLLLGLGYIYTKALWFPIAFHFSWNFFQGTIFGFNVSGAHLYSLINANHDTDNIWNGGNFGFEGSILSIYVQLIAFFLIIILFKDRKEMDLSIRVEL